MSKSDDNTNELESYGVWVKNSTGGSDTPETPADTSDDLNLDDGGLDLPDFDDSDFSDMFKEDAQNTDANALDDFGSLSAYKTLLLFHLVKTMKTVLSECYR